MGQVWFTSDWHFYHDREFLYKPRGFNSIYEMNDAIISRHNEVVQPEDDVYVLGDCILNDNDAGIRAIKQLKGQLHIVRGNHDTNTRMDLYDKCWNIVEITEGQHFKWNGYHFYLNHYPTITSNLEKDSILKHHLINLYGHTHQKTNFYNEIPFMYHVGMDSHNCYPINIEIIIEDIKEEVKKCKKVL